MIKAKELWLKERKPEEAIKVLPSRYRSTESHLLHGLSRFYSRNDFIASFTRLPRHQRLLYVHAYQSYLWNSTVSFRLQEYGFHPAVGDLVYRDSIQNEIDLPEANEEEG